jgi:hypothetical protein
MSIEASEMKEGLVVRDPTQNTHAPTRQFYKLGEPESEDGPWPATHCASGKRSFFRFGDLGRLVPVSGRVFCDVDLSALIGRRVRVDLKFGSKATGVVQEVRTFDLVIDGVEVSVPDALIIGEEEYAIKQIKTIEAAEK